jgi:hypothetical protein
MKKARGQVDHVSVAPVNSVAPECGRMKYGSATEITEVTDETTEQVICSFSMKQHAARPAPCSGRFESSSL